MKWWKTASVALGIVAAIGFAGCGSEQAANNADSNVQINPGTKYGYSRYISVTPLGT